MRLRTKTTAQYPKKKRKEIYSVTLDPDVVADSIALSEDANFSKHVGKALQAYNGYIRKCKK